MVNSSFIITDLFSILTHCPTTIQWSHTVNCHWHITTILKMFKGCGWWLLLMVILHNFHWKVLIQLHCLQRYFVSSLHYLPSYDLSTFHPTMIPPFKIQPYHLWPRSNTHPRHTMSKSTFIPGQLLKNVRPSLNFVCISYSTAILEGTFVVRT